MVSQRDRLIEIMGDEDQGAALGLPEIKQDAVHQPARVNVERREGLVQKNNSRLRDERLHRRALALPS
ncbi:hypothetical protein [Bradyrhizobium murdochi]|uniref:hypothetical protein n=1 Tax=Bradyrhizobium murdochi TaxID=1038859 RepID=UPI001F26D8A4|nr:hypothetical protein [Bradyrhizobium murdochi]